MSKQWVKEELHHSLLAQKLDAVLNWVAHNRERALGIAGGVVAAFVLAGVIVSKHAAARDNAWQKFFIAEQLASGGKLEDCIRQLDDVASQYSRFDAAGYATLLKGDLLFETGKYPEAAQAYEHLANSGPGALIPFALSGLASAKQAAKDYPGSIAAANKFADKYSTHFLAQQVYLTLAISQELSGDRVGAVSSYKKITGTYSNTYSEEIAKSRLPQEAAKK